MFRFIYGPFSEIRKITIATRPIVTGEKKATSESAFFEGGPYADTFKGFRAKKRPFRASMMILGLRLKSGQLDKIRP